MYVNMGKKIQKRVLRGAMQPKPNEGFHNSYNRMDIMLLVHVWGG